MLCIAFPVRAEQTPAVAPQVFRLDLSRTGGDISPLLFGYNLEHTSYAIWQGLSAQMLANRKFAGASTTDSRAPDTPEGFIGRLRTQGAPDPDGVAAHWYGIGTTGTNFYVDDEIAYAGRTAQRMDVLYKDSWGGVGQADLDVQAGTRYEIRLVLRTHFEMKARLRLCDRTGRKTYFQEDTSWLGNEWHVWITGWTADESDTAAKLEIMFEGAGTAWIGAASLLPADNFRGLRKDVIAALQEMSVPVLRWPGGNFTRNWKWKEGLLPVDRRPPVMGKNWEILRFTDNYDFQEIGIDDYIALCESLGAQPSLTLNITDELQNACDLLEYCNGPADSPWGKVRAERGHPAPYAVKLWSIGNENWGIWMGPAYFPPEEYAKQVHRFAAALRKIDPTIQLVGAGNGDGYCEKLVATAGKDLDLISVHHYTDAFESWPHGTGSLEIGRKPTLFVRDQIARFRTEVDRGTPRGTRTPLLTFDEWNLWLDWLDNEPLHGMYVASMLNMLCRESRALGLHSAMFFQPVMQPCGGVKVLSHSVHLSSAGQVFRLFRAHQGNVLLETPRPEADEDLDICASLDHKRNTLVVTMLNRSTQARPARLELAGTTADAVEARLLSAVDLRDPDSVFEEKALKVARKGAALSLELPAYSIARIEIGLGTKR